MHLQPGRENLKSFPFKKEMPCWLPYFWHSKFAKEIKTGEDSEVDDLIDLYKSTIKKATE